MKVPTLKEDVSVTKIGIASMHGSVQGELFDMNNFRISLIKKCSPRKFVERSLSTIDKYRTRAFGINRYKN